LASSLDSGFLVLVFAPLPFPFLGLFCNAFVFVVLTSIFLVDCNGFVVFSFVLNGLFLGSSTFLSVLF